jgi:hypothetical protein
LCRTKFDTAGADADTPEIGNPGAAALAGRRVNSRHLAVDAAAADAFAYYQAGW